MSVLAESLVELGILLELFPSAKHKSTSKGGLRYRSQEESRTAQAGPRYLQSQIRQYPIVSGVALQLPDGKAGSAARQDQRAGCLY